MDTWLTQEELSAIFGAIHDAEMRRLREEKARLEALTAEAEKGFALDRLEILKSQLKHMENKS